MSKSGRQDSMTVAEQTARLLTRHFHIATAEPIKLKEEETIELEASQAGRYVAYDFLAPQGREITFSVLVRGEVKITINGVEALNHRQAHMPGKSPPDGWHERWHDIIVWPERLIEGWVRIGVENPAASSTEITAEKILVCSGDTMRWRRPDFPSICGGRVDDSFEPDAALSDPAWKGADPLPLRKTSLVPRGREGQLQFLYSAECLYVGFRGDGRPEKAIQLEAEAGESDEEVPGLIEVVRLDVMNEEFIHLIFDPGADRRELIQFIVNGSGIKASSREVRRGQDGGLWENNTTELIGSADDPSSYPGGGLWRFDELDPELWRGWAAASENGWTACVAIPFSVIGKSPQDGDMWHFNAVRRTYGDHRIEYFASPHTDMPHNPNKFAELNFGHPSAIPLSADFGIRASGRRTATVKIASQLDDATRISGKLEVDSTPVSFAHPVPLDSREESNLKFDLNIEEREAANLAIVLTNENDDVVYRSAPVEFRMPRPPVAPKLQVEEMHVTIGAPDEPRPWARAEGETTIQLSAGRREVTAFQVGVMAGAASLSNVRLSISDLIGENGTIFSADRIEWFVVGSIHRDPNPAFLLRREIPSQRKEWQPDVLVPVDAFAIRAGAAESIWCEVDVPAEVALGSYRGTVTLLADEVEARSIPIEVQVVGFPAAAAKDALNIGTRKQHFIDDYVVGDVDGAVVQFHPFEKLPDPLIIPDSPGELPQIHLYGTILQDPDTGRYRMWYLSHGYGEARPCYHVCYAESDDGLRWEKPELGIREFAGSKKNNLIDIGEEMHFPGPSVVYRPDFPDPSRRYVRYFQSPASGGTCAAYSADGLHWEYVHKTLLRGSDAASASHDPRTGRYYFVTIEDHVIGAYVRRSPAVSVSEDGEHWSEFRRAVWADARDDRDAFRKLSASRATLSSGYPDHFHAEFNDMRPYPYGDLYLASVTVFECCGADIYKGTHGGRGSGKDDCVTNVQLLSSRSADLSSWQRVGDRRPVIARGAPGAWDGGFLTAADGPIIVGDELWMYYGGAPYSQQHEVNQFNTGPLFQRGDVPGGIGLSKIRLDGFVSVDAEGGAGKLITKPLQFAGRALEVNAVARGNLRVAMLDESGKSIPGLGESDCEPVQGDSVRHRIRWKDETALAQLAGTVVCIAFHLQDASLYAFQFRA